MATRKCSIAFQLSFASCVQFRSLLCQIDQRNNWRIPSDWNSCPGGRKGHKCLRLKCELISLFDNFIVSFIRGFWEQYWKFILLVAVTWRFSLWKLLKMQLQLMSDTNWFIYIYWAFRRSLRRNIHLIFSGWNGNFKQWVWFKFNCNRITWTGNYWPVNIWMKMLWGCSVLFCWNSESA